MTVPLDVFARHRRLLFRVAYQMLGSVADAEDTVQDAWLRWSASGREDVADPRAYLVQITSRLALDRLRSARTRRETYVGPWLPEPLLTGGTQVGSGPPSAEPDAAAELGEQVSLAVLVVVSMRGSHEFNWRDAILTTVVLIAFSIFAFVWGIELQIDLWPSVLR